MSSGTASEQDKRALYWLGERLIDYRHPVMIVVLVITGIFAYWSFQLKLETSFGDLLPQSHPFVQVHNKYAGTSAGANNIQLMVESKEGDTFNVPTLTRIYKTTEEMDRAYGVNHTQTDSTGHRTTRNPPPQSAGSPAPGGAGAGDRRYPLPWHGGDRRRSQAGRHDRLRRGPARKRSGGARRTDRQAPAGSGGDARRQAGRRRRAGRERQAHDPRAGPAGLRRG